MNVLFNEVFTTLEKFPRNDDRAGGPIVAVLFLSFGNFDNHLGCRMLNVHLFQNGCTIVGDNDITHAIDEHLVHAFGTQCGPNCVCNRFCGCNVVALCTFPSGSIGTFFEDKDRLLSTIHCSFPPIGAPMGRLADSGLIHKGAVKNYAPP